MILSLSLFTVLALWTRRIVALQSSKTKHNDCLQLPLAFKSVNRTSIKANAVLRACSNFGCWSLLFQNSY